MAKDNGEDSKVARVNGVVKADRDSGEVNKEVRVNGEETNREAGDR